MKAENILESDALDLATKSRDFGIKLNLALHIQHAQLELQFEIWKELKAMREEMNER